MSARIDTLVLAAALGFGLPFAFAHAASPCEAGAPFGTCTDRTHFDADVTTASSQGVVVVCYVAQWCSLCKDQARILNTAHSQLAGKLGVFYVDVDAEVEVSVRYGIRGLPTIQIFSQGTEVNRFVGDTKMHTLADALTPYLGSVAKSVTQP